MWDRYQKKILEDVIFSAPSCHIFSECHIYLCILPVLCSQIYILKYFSLLKFDSSEQLKHVFINQYNLAALMALNELKNVWRHIQLQY